MSRIARLLLFISLIISLIATFALPAAAQQPTTLRSEGLTGWYTDLVLLPDGRPVISYYDNSTGSLWLALCNDAVCSAPIFTLIDNSAPDVGRWTALALARNDLPVITYRDHTNGNLKLALCDDNTTCANPTIAILDGQGADVGWHSDIVVDNFNLAVIVYRDDTPAPNNTVRFLACDLDDLPLMCSAPQTVNTVGPNGGYNYLTLDENGFINHEYHDGSNTYFTVYQRNTGPLGFSYTLATTTTSDTQATWFIDGALPPVGAAPRRTVRTGYQTTSGGGLRLLECTADFVGGGAQAECAQLGNERQLTTGFNGLFAEVTYPTTQPTIYYHDVTEQRLEAITCADSYCDTPGIPVNIDTDGNPGFYLAGELDALNQPVLSYMDDANDDLRLLYPAAAGDPAPEVAFTSPRDGQSGTGSGDFIITFSEQVDIGIGGVTVACTGGYAFSNSAPINGTLVFGQSGLPGSASGTCTVTLDNTLITDNSAQPMPQPYTFAYNTTSPALVGTVPAQNDSAQPHSRITISYSGLVNLLLSDVTLQCNSTDVPFTGLFGIQQSEIVLTPIEPMPEGASCVLTVRTDPADGGNTLDAASSLPYENIALKLGVESVPFQPTEAQADLAAELDAAAASSTINFTVASGAAANTCFATPDDGATVFGSTDSSAVQQAINAANAGDTVKIAGTCTGTAENGNIGDAAVDDSELMFIDKALTLIGGYDPAPLNLQNPAAWLAPTVSFSTLDAASTGRVALFGPNADVTLQNLILQNGNADFGAGFYNAGGALTLDTVRVQSNLANLAGGGFFNDDGAVTVQNNSVIGGEQGGTGNLVVCDAACQSASNFPSVPNGSGGGFFTTGVNASIVIDNSDISGNRVQDESALPFGFGGGFAQSNESSVTLQNSATIGGSTAARGNEADNGAGFINTGGTVTLFDSTVSHNIAHATGAGFFNFAENPSPATTLIVDNSQISDNTSFGLSAGGGFNNATLEVRNGSRFEDNRATNGGGLYISNIFNTTTIIDNSIFSNNGTDPDNNSVFDGVGGAIYNDNVQGAGLFIRNHTRIENNSALLGGGLYNRYVFGTINPVTVENSSISGNTATDNGGATANAGFGGGIHNDGGEVNITQNSLVQNNVADSQGGGIFNTNGGDVTIQNGSLIGGEQGSTGNTADEGAGVYNDASVFTLNNSSISGNAATGNGGGLFNTDGGTATVENNSLIGGTQGTTGNNADNGGGFYNENAASVTLTDSTISGNDAANFGGGFRNIGSGSQVTLNNSHISTNTSGQSGGGFVNSGEATVSVQANSRISANTTTILGGGFYNFNANSTVTLTDSTLSGNSTPLAGTAGLELGGGFYNSDGVINLTRSSIGGLAPADANVAELGGGFWMQRGTLTIEQSAIVGNQAGGGNGVGGGFVSDAANSTLTNVTISGNTADVSAGAFSESGASGGLTLNYVTVVNNASAGSNAVSQNSIAIANSIIAANGTNCDFQATLNDLGGNYSDASGCASFSTDADLIIDNGSNGGLLAALAVNAPGSSATHALRGDSTTNDAIDGASSAPATQPTTDQRGFPRPQGAARDSGAYELGAQCYTFDGTTQRTSSDHRAVQDALNANPGGGTIRIAGYCAGVSDEDTANGSETLLITGAAFTLAGGYDASPAVNGTGPIDWNNPTGAETVLDARQAGRVAYITGTADATLQALTLRNGYVSNADGGGLYNAGGTLVLDASTVQANTADEGEGGGLYNDGGAVTVQNGSLIGGDSTQGEGNRALCTACAGNVGAGGGIASRNGSGSVTINNSNVSGNAATMLGAGVFDVSGNLTVENNSVIGGTLGITGNTAPVGAGLYMSGATLSDSSISGNDGQGFYVSGISTLTNVDITDNVAGFSAGFRAEGGTLTLQNSRIANNRATGDMTQSGFGGGFGVGGVPTTAVILDNTIVENNIAEGSVAGLPSQGGGFANISIGHVEIRNGSIVRNNRAEQGAGFYNTYGDPSLPQATVTLDASLLYGNSTDVDGDGVADGDGGGFYNEAGGLVRILNGSVLGGDSTLGRGNVAEDGGGFYSAGVDTGGTVFSEVLIDASSIQGNRAEENGGGFYNGGNGIVTVQNGSLIGGTQGTTGNTAFSGAAFANDSRDLNDPALADVGDTPNSTVILDNVSSSGNVAESAGGGGFSRAIMTVQGNSTIGGVLDVTGNEAAVGAGLYSITNDAQFMLHDSRVIGNRSTTSGGAGVLASGSASVNSIMNVEVSGNVSGSNGGGITLSRAATNLTNVTISGNSAVLRGGGLYSLDDNVVATYVTIVDNTAPDGAGVFAFTGQDLVVNIVDFANSIVADNNGLNCDVDGSVQTVPGDYIDSGGNYTDDLSNCPGTFNVDSNLTLGNLLGALQNNGGFSQTHALLAGNPAIDGGSSSLPAQHTDATTDQRGLPRPATMIGLPDAGAYEDQGVNGGSGIMVIGVDAYPDHVQQRQTTLSITLTQPADPTNALLASITNVTLGVLYSPDATCTAEDVLLSLQPFALSTPTQTVTLPLSIPHRVLRAQLDPASQPVGTPSQDVGYLCVATSEALSTPGFTVDADASKLQRADDITYFPWDVDGNGVVTTTEAVDAVQALGQAASLQDYDGNGVVSPREVLDTVTRLGYLRHTSVVEAAPDAATQAPDTARPVPSGR